MNRCNEAFETAKWQRIFKSFFPFSLYSKSADYILFYILSDKQHFLYKGQMSKLMNAVCLLCRYLPASYSGTKRKSNGQGTRETYYSNLKGFEIAVIVLCLMAQGPSESSWFPGSYTPLNTLWKNSLCAWKFDLTGQCRLVGVPPGPQQSRCHCSGARGIAHRKLANVFDPAMCQTQKTEFFYFSMPYFRPDF